MNTQFISDELEINEFSQTSKVLLLNIYKSTDTTISSNTLYSLFSPYGKVQKILIFEKSAMQKAFIEFKNLEAAIQAKMMLDNQMINNALIKIYYSKQQQISLKRSGQNAIDYSQIQTEPADLNQNLYSIQNSVESTSCSNNDDSFSQTIQQQYGSDQFIQDSNYPSSFIQNLSIKQQQQMNNCQNLNEDIISDINLNNTNNNLLLFNENNQISKTNNFQSFFQNPNNNQKIQQSQIKQNSSFADELISQLITMKNQTQNSNYSLFGTKSNDERSQEVSSISSGEENSPLKFSNSPNQNKSQININTQKQLQNPLFQSEENLLFQQFQSFNINNNINQQSQVQQRQPQQIQQQFSNQFVNQASQIDYDLNFNDQLLFQQQQINANLNIQTTFSPPPEMNLKSKVLVIRNLDPQFQLNAKLIFLIFNNFGNIRLLQYLIKRQEILLEFENQQQASCAKNFIANYEIGGCRLAIDFYCQQNIPPKIQTYDEMYIYGNQKEFRFDGKTDLNKLNPPSATLHVSNISPQAYDISVLYNIFQQYGKIENIKLYQKNNRNMSFIKFQSVTDSFNAMGLHGEEYFGRKFHISFTRMKI